MYTGLLRLLDTYRAISGLLKLSLIFIRGGSLYYEHENNLEYIININYYTYI